MPVHEHVATAAPLYELRTFGELQLFRCADGEAVAEVGRKLWEVQSHEFAQPVRRAETIRLDEEVKAWRKSNSTNTQNAYLLDASGTAVLVRPAIVGLRDSATVVMTFTRRYSDSFPRNNGLLGLESQLRPLMRTIDADLRRHASQVASGLVHFMRSMETCKLEGRRHLFASPWCWKSRDELAVVPGAASARSEAFFEEVRRAREATLAR